MVDRDRRDAAPVVDPGVEEQRKVVVGEVRRRLHVRLRAEQDARRRDRPELLLERRHPGWSAIRVPGLARKFCTITSPRWPYSSPSSRSASSASRRSARVSPIPIRIPLVNGIASSPASRIVSSRAAGNLSGEAQCGPPRSASRSASVSSMIPIEAETGRSELELRARSSRPGSGAAADRSPRARAARSAPGTRSSSRSRARRARRARPGSEARACRRA